MASTITQWLKVTQNEKGLGLVEAVVAVAVTGVTVVAFVAALSTGSIAVAELDQEVVAQRLTRTQLEFIKGSAYDTSYTSISTPAGYTISIDVDAIPGADSDIQEITVTIFRDGNEILTVEDYKVNR